MLAGACGLVLVSARRGKRDCAPAKEPLVLELRGALTASYYILHTSSPGNILLREGRLLAQTPYSLLAIVHRLSR